MEEDPISQFFPDEENVDLYAVLDLTRDASPDDIKKGYRHLALKYHPDKQGPTTDKHEATLKFQQIGFAYTVLSDERRRKKFDETGRTDEGFEDLVGEDGWDAYFGAIFESVTRQKLDEMKAEYQGSQEESDDLKEAYTQTEGSIAEIMTHIPHSTHDDEARFVLLILKLIKGGELESLPLWEAGLADEKAKLLRKKKGDEEAQEAESLAKELGVWDEFYGSGAKGKRKGKGKGKSAGPQEEDDVSALQALILKKKDKAGSFLDNLAAKYSQPEKKQPRKRKQDDSSSEPQSRKRNKPSEGPPPTEEEFKELQEKMFAKGAGQSSKGTKGKKQKR